MQNFIHENKERFLNELLDLLKIPSVSADPSYKGDVVKAAEFLKGRFLELEMDRVEIYPTNGHPIV